MDGANFAAGARHPTDILLTRGGFKVVAMNGARQAAKHVPFGQLELATDNPLMAAIQQVNRQVQR